MNLLRNLLALIGLLAVVLVVYSGFRIYPDYQRFQQLDPQAGKVYGEMFEKLLETGNSAEATVWKVQVEEGLTPKDVEEVVRFVANEHNIKNVGELPLYKQVEAMSGKPYRFATIYMFCNALTAARMMDYSDAFSAYLPCRVSLIEDKQGRLWIYSLNMDMMIHGGKTLPPDLKEEAMQVKEIILDIMNRGARGEF
ncbi:MAG TPA: DUF302 domain-containing protein [Chromatiales bacterium]|nr:DUF302 domain-containing protein [Chromatiales bacterium]